MSQKQKIVEVLLKSGKTSKAIATGNNAAWICVCGRNDPLLGRSSLVDRLAAGFRVDCPDCSCCYYVIPDGKDQGAVLNVIEV
ncbi:MAG: hypothetical protein HOG03_09550 [Desulfobacula sp.]|jgi:hypothetical protein|uniref:hypothetical protein n=1 Tax=Desulfobacula sp. TaxID=2593537 RepID=UPI001DF0A564|nr:hypothetical protein [Desulfobacula sp.]MBT3485486.1 hypothetical protein [Desulfobacula sp.]MBT3804832.1 hypothetical protein [Desulfobacula sp.]MBT4026193.1 hypothetical protein [Desulfobacula sp.]MBT4199758.1 hypothetical protein [Desulfobacula sp.]